VYWMDSALTRPVTVVRAVRDTSSLGEKKNMQMNQRKATTIIEPPIHLRFEVMLLRTRSELGYYVTDRPNNVEIGDFGLRLGPGEVARGASPWH
jgi:hypothetical protein